MGVGADVFPFSLRDSTLCRPKGSAYFFETSILADLKRLERQTYSNFEGERAPKKRNFLSKFSKKSQKNRPSDLKIRTLPSIKS